MLRGFSYVDFHLNLAQPIGLVKEGPVALSFPGFPRHPARRVSSGNGHGSKDQKEAKERPEDFKREAVRLLEGRGERSVADVAAGLGVAENLLHAWKKKFGSAAEQVRRERGGETAEEELKRLRREVTQLKQERDVLKKSVAVFARDRS